MSRIEFEQKAWEEIYGISSPLVKTILFSPFLIVLLYYLLLTMSFTRPTAFLMLNENYPLELLTFGFLVWGGIQGLVLAWQAKNRGEGILVLGFYTVFSFALLINAMEEAAWGQWFFGFKTPSVLKDINIQGEFTVHNIRGLEGHSEFFRVTFGLGGLLGVWLSSHRKFRKIGAPVMLSPWFFVIFVLAGIDLYNDYFSIQSDFDFTIQRLAELVEMMIGIAGLLFVWLNARMLSNDISRINSHYIFPTLIILGLAIFLAINNISWAIKYIFPMPELFDQAFYLDLGLTYLKAWQNGGLVNLLSSVLHSSPYHAPLFPLTTVPFYLICGMSKNSAYLTNIIYMFLMLLSTYLIGEKLFRPKAGFLSVFMLSTFTAFIEYSREYLLDFPQAAMFTWSMFCLIKTKSLQNRKWSVLFGISTGLTLLIKTMAGVYFVGPLLWMVLKSLRIKDRLKDKTINFLLSMGACAVVAGVYYLPNLKTIFWYLFYFGFGEGSLDYYMTGKTLFSIDNLLLYPLSTIEIGVSYPLYLLSIIILIILIVGLIKRRSFSGVLADKGLLLVWLFSGYFILTLSPNKAIPEYMIALIPAVVVLVCGLVVNIPWKQLRVMTLLIIFIGGMINYIALTYGIKGLPNIYNMGDNLLFSQKSIGTFNLSNLNIELLPELDEINSAEYLVSQPEKPLTNNNWKFDEILENIKNNSQSSIDNVKIAIVPSHFLFNANIFKYRANVLDLKFQITELNRQDYKMHLESSDYVIIKSGFQGPDFANRSNGQMLEYIDSRYAEFEKMSWEFVLPDHSKAVVYRRKPNFFISNLGNAIIKAKEKYVTVASSGFTINNDSRAVLFQHPPSKITYKLAVPENSSLTFGIALNPDVWSADKGDGVLFELYVQDGDMPEKVFSKYIDPKQNIADRKWHDEVVELSRYGGKEVSLSFVTTSGFNNNNNFDWAVWADPRLMSIDKNSSTNK